MATAMSLEVRHVKGREDPAAGSMDGDAWAYRTEVHNAGTVPLRVIWFEAYELFGDFWGGGNIKNRPLTNDDFVKWYAEGDAMDDGWLAPGATAACDPNWHISRDGELPRLKWCFLAVDAEGRDFPGEAEVPREAATLVAKS